MATETCVFAAAVVWARVTERKASSVVLTISAATAGTRRRTSESESHLTSSLCRSLRARLVETTWLRSWVNSVIEKMTAEIATVSEIHGVCSYAARIAPDELTWRG